MRLLPRRPTGSDDATDDPARSPVADDVSAPRPKGRPTPKRRDAEPKRGPVTAPKTRKEASQRQRQQAKQERASASTPQQRRSRMLAGDPEYLSRRDAGPLKALARDYVDSRRMLSNGLLVLFPLILLSVVVRTPVINIVILGVFVLVLLEWMNAGRKIMVLADSRGIDKGRTTSVGIGFYGGSRAYLPRKWRVPRPRLQVGDSI